MPDRIVLVEKTETLARDYLTELVFPLEISAKLVRETLHCRLNDILQRECMSLFTGERVNPRDRRRYRHMIADLVGEALRGIGYHYNESKKCYERKSPEELEVSDYNLREARQINIVGCFENPLGKL